MDEDMKAYQSLYKPRHDKKTGRRLFDIGFTDLRSYADAAGNVTVKAWNHAREVHEEKLARAR
jgi:hypothetical protein